MSNVKQNTGGNTLKVHGGGVFGSAAAATTGIWTATTDMDHGRAGILQFYYSKQEMSSTGTARIYIERVGGYVGAVSCRVVANSTTGDCAMTSGTHFTATTETVSFSNQEAGVKYIDIAVGTSPGSGLHYFVVTMDTAAGGVSLRNPEMQVYFDDGGVNSGATIITGGADFSATVNAASAGDLIYLRSGTDYSNNTRTGGYNEGGYLLTANGTQTARIVLSAYPSETPIINQLYADTSDGAGYRVTVGILAEGNYLTIKGLEIKGCLASGVQFSSVGNSTNLIVEDCHIHDLGNPVGGAAGYPLGVGSGNIGGIRMDYSTAAVFRNNNIHDIYDSRSTGNTINAELYGLHTGIHGYNLIEPWIHNNTIDTVRVAVYCKHPNATSDFGHRVHHNLSTNLDVATFEASSPGGGVGAQDHYFYNNLSILPAGSDSPVSVVAIDGGLTSAMDRLHIYSNTQIGGAWLLSASTSREIVLHSNTVQNTKKGISLLGAQPLGGAENTTIDYCDYNNYEGSDSFTLDRYEASSTTYATLAAFQGAYPDSQLLNDAETSGTTATPTYVNSGSNDYRTLTGSTIAVGRFGRDQGIGASVVGQQVGQTLVTA